MTILKITDLSIAYKKHTVLENINLEMSPGECLGLMAPSGTGKTTLINAIAGILPESAACHGSMVFAGQELVGNPQLHRRLQGTALSLLPQQPVASLFPLATIGQQLYHVQKAHGATDKGMAQKQAAGVLSNLGINDPQRIMDAYPCQISGGQAQRICLAMCLLQKPRLLLADEPTASLDTQAQEDELEQLQLLRKLSSATALLIASHNRALLEKIATRIVTI